MSKVQIIFVVIVLLLISVAFYFHMPGVVMYGLQQALRML